ncbi:MAG: cytidylate kinase-like family protein [Oscillospiraceae bacterium]|nr:cytidylate kinase-like family protein [Oscillospiraceae bacterium]
MDKHIIAISREYGSGGRHIGELLAKELDIPFYDKEIIQMAAQKSGMSAGFIEKSDESIPNTFLHNLKYSAYSSYDSISYYDTPVTDKVFLAQSAVIKELASQGSCVIVGRCAHYILRNEPDVIAIFIRANLDDRVRHAVEHYDLPQQNALDRIKKIDKSRINYYKYYTSRQWGSIENYDLVINSSFSGIDGAVAVIKAMLLERSNL